MISEEGFASVFKLKTQQKFIKVKAQGKSDCLCVYSY